MHFATWGQAQHFDTRVQGQPRESEVLVGIGACERRRELKGRGGGEQSGFCSSRDLARVTFLQGIDYLYTAVALRATYVEAYYNLGTSAYQVPLPAIDRGVF